MASISLNVESVRANLAETLSTAAETLGKKVNYAKSPNEARVYQKLSQQKHRIDSALKHIDCEAMEVDLFSASQCTLNLMSKVEIDTEMLASAVDDIKNDKNLEKANQIIIKFKEEVSGWDSSP